MDNALEVISRAIQRGSHSYADPFYDKWSAEAARISEGINASGILSAIGGMGSSVDALALTVSTDLGQINATVDLGFSELSEILRNPLGTQVEERLRRGLTALSNLWIEDAIRELTLAIDLDPMLYEAHYALSVALAQSGQGSDAVIQFQRAAKYSLPTDPELAAGAILQAQAILCGDGHSDQAISLLHHWCPRLRCAELDLRLAVLDQTFTDLDAAFNAAPELILPTALSGARQVLDYAARLEREQWTPYIDARRLQVAVAKETIGENEGSDDITWALIEIPREVPGMLRHVTELLSKRREILNALLERLRNQIDDAQQLEHIALQTINKKGASVTKKVATIDQWNKTLATHSLLTPGQEMGDEFVSESLARVEESFQGKRRIAAEERTRLTMEMTKRQAEISELEHECANNVLLRSKYADGQARVSALLSERGPYAQRLRPRFGLRRLPA